MSRRDPRLRLIHMRDHAREAMELARGRTEAEIAADRLRALALARLLEIIGEAAQGVPEATRNRAPSIPWSAVVGLRNRLIHGYDAVDLAIVWQIVQRDLDPLVADLDRLLAEWE